MKEGAGRPAFRVDRDPWVPVLYDDGSTRSVSLRALLLDAPRICEVVPEFPQQRLPILRLALSVLYRAYGSAYEGPAPTRDESLQLWGEIWEQRRFDDEVVECYLDRFAGRFDLFDEERPFFQTAGLAYRSGADAKDCDPVSEVIADCPKPKKYLFAMKARNALGDIPFDEAARWLVYLQAYDTAGIKTPVVGNTHVNKGKVYPPKEAVGTGWLGAIGAVFVQGGNLFETLMLNWVLCSDRAPGGIYLCSRDDLPPWERAQQGPRTDLYEAYADGYSGIAVGPVSLGTWQSRRARLVPNEDGTAVTGIVTCYGDILRPADLAYAETMTAWRESPEQKKKLGTAHLPLMPVRHAPSRSLWRGLSSLLLANQGTGGQDMRPTVVQWLGTVTRLPGVDMPRTITLNAQGMAYGTQSSVYEDAIDDSFAMGPSLMAGDPEAVAEAVDVLKDTENAVGVLVRYVRSLEEIAGSKDASGDEARERAYTELDGLFRERLAGFAARCAEDVLAYGASWRAEVHATLRALGGEYVQRIGPRQFASHTGRAVARATRWFETEIDTILVRRYRPGAENAYDEKG